MWKRIIRISWLIVVCNFFAQSLLTSIITLGWIYRWVQYDITIRLFKKSSITQNQNKNNQWRQFSRSNSPIIKLQKIPNFLWRQQGFTSGEQPPNAIVNQFHKFFHSLWLNCKIGFSGILTTWSLTAIPSIIWAMAWYTGWHISFNKMYEESATGVSLSLLGIFLFSVIMFYLPLAQARHSFTQDWRSFFDYRFIKTMVLQCPLQVFFLAFGYALCGLIATLIKIMPLFFPAMNPQLELLSSSEALKFLNGYYFYTGLILLLLFFILKTCTGGIYASTLRKMWEKKLLSKESFHTHEVNILELFHFEYGVNYRQPKLLTQAVKFPFFFSYKTIVLSATFIVWSIFNFLPFVSEFLNYYPFWGFLNQPLVQLPCFRYVPDRLQRKPLQNKPSDIAFSSEFKIARSVSIEEFNL